MPDRSVLIGVSGGSASGKSRLSRELCNIFGVDSTLITQDDYYFDSSALTEKEKAEKNYDHPDAIDLDRLQENLRDLQSGSVIDAPIYCFETHARLSHSKVVSPTRIIIVEGLFVLGHPEIRNLLDIKVFLSVASDIRLLRRIMRDVDERGRTLGSVATQYLDTVRPMHKKFVEPTKDYADIVLFSGDDKDIDIAIAKLTEMINKLFLSVK